MHISTVNKIAAVKALIEDEKLSPTAIRSLAQLRKIFEPLNVNVYRSPSGYYYFTSEEFAPSSGVYTYSVKDTSLGYWLSYLLDYLTDAQ
jgi:hypothetical protein